MLHGIFFVSVYPMATVYKPSKNTHSLGAWVAQSVKPPTLGFSSVHDLGVVGWIPASGSALSAESAGNYLPPPLLFLSQINKIF